MRVKIGFELKQIVVIPIVDGIHALPDYYSFFFFFWHRMWHKRI